MKCSTVKSFVWTALSVLHRNRNPRLAIPQTFIQELLDRTDVVEVELNPVLVGTRGATAVDALLIVEE